MSYGLLQQADMFCRITKQRRENEVMPFILQTSTEVVELVGDLAARIRELEDRVKALEEALKPFADEAIRYEPHEDDNNDTAWDSDFTVGDLRRAAAAVKGE